MNPDTPCIFVSREERLSAILSHARSKYPQYRFVATHRDKGAGWDYVICLTARTKDEVEVTLTVPVPPELDSFDSTLEGAVLRLTAALAPLPTSTARDMRPWIHPSFREALSRLLSAALGRETCVLCLGADAFDDALTAEVAVLPVMAPEPECVVVISEAAPACEEAGLPCEAILVARLDRVSRPHGLHDGFILAHLSSMGSSSADVEIAESLVRTFTQICLPSADGPSLRVSL